MITRLLPVISRLLITLLLLILIFSNFDGTLVLGKLQQFKAQNLILIMMVNVTLILLMVKRWQLLASSLGVRASYFHFLKAFWIGVFSGLAGPSLIFFEYARYRVLKKYGEKWQIIGSQALDRLIGQLTLLILILLLLPIYLPLLTDSFLNGLIALVFFLIFFSGLIFIAIRRYRSVADINITTLITTLNPLRTRIPYLISLTIQGLLMTTFMLAADGVGSLPQPLLFMLLVPLVMATLTLMPISVSDWGTREAAATIFLTYSGISAEQVLAASIVFGACWTMTALFGVIFFWLDK